MAEAAVQERPPARFYCHMCNVEFQNAANVSARKINFLMFFKFMIDHLYPYQKNK